LARRVSDWESVCQLEGCLQTTKHFLCLGIGQQTPPVAAALFTVAVIARLPLWEVFKASWPFTLVLALATLLVTYVPWLSLGLVNLVKW